MQFFYYQSFVSITCTCIARYIKLTPSFPFLISEVQEMEENLPKTCKVNFEDPNTLHKFTLIITPDEGFWHGGRFKFTLNIPDEYNILVCYIGLTTVKPV